MAVTTETDEALLTRYARRKDRDALGELVSRHWPGTFRLALMLVDRTTAEDVAQEAFVNLARWAPRFDPEKSFLPWFRAIVVNVARNAARGQRTRAFHARRVLEERRRSAPHADEPSRGIAEAFVREKLEEVPWKNRHPLVLHYYEGCSLEEIAAITGSKKPTVQSRIKRGIEQLREALAGGGFALSVASLESWFREARTGPSTTSAPPPPTVARIELLAEAARRGAMTKIAGIAATLLVTAVAAIASWETLFGSAGDSRSSPTTASTATPDRAAALPAGTSSSKTPSPPPAPATLPASSPGPGAPATAPVHSAEGDPTVRPAVTGRVFDATTERPLAGVHVAVTRKIVYPNADPEGWYPDGSTDTDAEGRFELGRLPGPGEAWTPIAVLQVTVSAQAPGYEPFLRTFDARTRASPFDLRLAPGPGSGVRGTVRDARGEPVSGLELVATLEAGGCRASGRFEGEATTPDELIPDTCFGGIEKTVTTDAKGGFTLSGFPRGWVSLHVSQDAPRKLQPWTLGRVSLRTERDPAEARIVVRHFATLDVTVLDANGSPTEIEDARIRVERPTHPGWHAGGVARAAPLRDREYSMLEAGRWEVRVETARGTVTESLSLDWGETRAVTIAPPGEPARLTCHATFEDGRPAAGLTLLAAPESGPSRRFEGALDESGSVTLEGLATGRWTVTVSPLERTVEVASSTRVELVVPERPPLRGVVLDESGAPIASAAVSVWGSGTTTAVPSRFAGPPVEARTGPDGRFDLGPLPRGSYSPRIVARGFEPLDDMTVLGDFRHEGREVPFTLRKGRALVVLGALPSDVGPSVAVRGAILRSGWSRGESAKHATRQTTASEGRFELQWESLGELEPADLVVGIEGYLPIVRALRGDETEVDLGTLTFERGQTLRGRLHDPDHLLESGAKGIVWLVGSSFTSLFATRVEKDGTFETRGVPLEPLTLHARVEATGKVIQATLSLDPERIARSDLGTIEPER